MRAKSGTASPARRVPSAWQAAHQRAAISAPSSTVPARPAAGSGEDQQHGGGQTHRKPQRSLRPQGRGGAPRPVQHLRRRVPDRPGCAWSDGPKGGNAGVDEAVRASNRRHGWWWPRCMRRRCWFCTSPHMPRFAIHTSAPALRPAGGGGGVCLPPTKPIGHSYRRGGAGGSVRASARRRGYASWTIPIRWWAKWLEAVWPAPDGRLFGWYHAEEHAPLAAAVVHPPHRPRAVGGRRAQQLAASGRRAARAGGAGRSCRAQRLSLPAAMAIPTGVLPDRAGRWVYCALTSYVAAERLQGVALIRWPAAAHALPPRRTLARLLECREKAGAWRPLRPPDEPPPPRLPVRRDWREADPDAFWGPASIHWNHGLGRYVHAAEPHPRRRPCLPAGRHPPLFRRAVWTGRSGVGAPPPPDPRRQLVSAGRRPWPSGVRHPGRGLRALLHGRPIGLAHPAAAGPVPYRAHARRPCEPELGETSGWTAAVPAQRKQASAVGEAYRLRRGGAGCASQSA